MHSLRSVRSRPASLATGRGGFTLIELLIVMSMLGILIAITVVAINPRKHLCEAQNAKRNITTRELANAVNQFFISTGDLPNAESIPLGFDYAMPICLRGVDGDASCLNFDMLVPEYLIDLPADAAELNQNYTGYKIYRDGEGVALVISTTILNCTDF